MKGIVFHWDDPWKDIYSGLDPVADAWAYIGQAFDLDMVAIERTWPFPERHGIRSFKSLDDFLKSVKGDRVVLADYQEPGTPNPKMHEVDWLVLGPADGWQKAYPTVERWCYRPSPPSGFHAVHLAHIVAHLSREVD